MDQTSRAERIAQHLHVCGNAHFEYEAAVLAGEYDQQWSDWYAAYLLAHDWNELFTRAWDVNTLAETLRQLHQQYTIAAPEMTWQEFYAERFAEMS